MFVLLQVNSSPEENISVASGGNCPANEDNSQPKDRNPTGTVVVDDNSPEEDDTGYTAIALYDYQAGNYFAIFLRMAKFCLNVNLKV